MEYCSLLQLMSTSYGRRQTFLPHRRFIIKYNENRPTNISLTGSPFLSSHHGSNIAAKYTEPQFNESFLAFEQQNNTKNCQNLRYPRILVTGHTN